MFVSEVAWAAYLNFEEKEKGSIEKNKFAEIINNLASDRVGIIAYAAGHTWMVR